MPIFCLPQCPTDLPMQRLSFPLALLTLASGSSTNSERRGASENATCATAQRLLWCLGALAIQRSTGDQGTPASPRLCCRRCQSKLGPCFPSTGLAGSRAGAHRSSVATMNGTLALYSAAVMVATRSRSSRAPERWRAVVWREGEGSLDGVRVCLGHRFAAAWERVRAAFGDG